MAQSTRVLPVAVPALAMPVLLALVWAMLSLLTSYVGPGISLERMQSATGEAGRPQAESRLAIPNGGCLPTWEAVDSPQLGNLSLLRSVATVANNDVWAVGYYDSTGQQNARTQVMHWDGTQWVVVPSPNSGSYNNVLSGVAAITSTDIWAVGYYVAAARVQTLILHWDGTAWSIVTSPNVGSGDNYLSGVAARAGNDVWAVGDYDSAGVRPLILHWDGTAWTSVTSPSAGLLSVLNGVTALSPTNAWAVGYFNSGSQNLHTLIMHWDGSTWSVIPSPNPGVDENILASISAASPDDIWAAGTYGTAAVRLYPLLLHWNGLDWESIPSTTIGSLYGVQMLASNDGWAVGKSAYTLILHWDGTGWHTVFSANPGYPTYKLEAVAAVTATDIWTVGESGVTSKSSSALIEHYTGRCVTATPTSTPTRVPSTSPASPTPTASVIATPGVCPTWYIVPSPNVGSYSDLLEGVGGLAPSDVWAVGSYLSGAVNNTLSLHWDGSRWSVVPSPNQGTDHNYLHSVAPLAPNDVWAVGEYYTGSIFQTLTEHWDGSRWSIVPSPNVGTGPNFLNSVTGRTGNDVWAVGTSSSSSNVETLTEHWDGSRWIVVPSPNGGSTTNQLRNAVAVAANDVWAVGDYFTGSAVRTLTEHWDGTQWNIVPSPNVGTSDNFLFSATAAGATDVWAAGLYHNGSVYQTLTLRWDGSGWSVISSPNIGSGSSWLFAVGAADGNDVWAAGHSSDGGTDRTLTMHWDGSAWTVVPSPNADAGQDELKGLDVFGGDVWAVGFSGTATFRTLTLHFSPACVTPTSTPPPCLMAFADVQPSDYFYQAVRYLYCRGIISGYGDNTFRPYNNTTRGQLAKIVVLAEGWPLYAPASPTFQDVPAGHAFYQYIETAYSHGIISGYDCGAGCLEFRPGNNITRGQLCKVIVLAKGWPLYAPPEPTFQDVPVGSTFFRSIETAYAHNIISGYACGTGCVEFRPGNNATRGQISKIVYLAATSP